MDESILFVTYIGLSMLIFGLTTVILTLLSITGIIWILTFTIPFALISISPIFFYNPDEK